MYLTCRQRDVLSIIYAALQIQFYISKYPPIAQKSGDTA